MRRCSGVGFFMVDGEGFEPPMCLCHWFTASLLRHLHTHPCARFSLAITDWLFVMNTLLHGLQPSVGDINTKGKEEAMKRAL